MCIVLNKPANRDRHINNTTLFTFKDYMKIVLMYFRAKSTAFSLLVTVADAIFPKSKVYLSMAVGFVGITLTTSITARPETARYVWFRHNWARSGVFVEKS